MRRIFQTQDNPARAFAAAAAAARPCRALDLT